MKKCTKCGVEKAETEFYKRKMSHDGLQPKCKPCKVELDGQHYKDNRQKRIDQVTAYRKSNPESYNAYRRELQNSREATDINFRLRRRLRTRVYHALTGYQKASTTMDLIGCSLEDLRTYLEAQFEAGMTWDNYGDWHVDHIYPLGLIDLSSAAEQRKAFNYLNLRPRWAAENMAAGNTAKKPTAASA